MMQKLLCTILVNILKRCIVQKYFCYILIKCLFCYKNATYFFKLEIISTLDIGGVIITNKIEHYLGLKESAKP